MLDINKYKMQHNEILSLLNFIDHFLNEKNLQNQKNADQIRSTLSQMSGKLAIHLSMEDQSLYPLALQSKDQRIHNMARQFQNEMGQISEKFNQFRKRWVYEESIQDESQEFIVCFQELAKIFRQRIDREEEDFYPLLVSDSS